jgi:pimeloyl-ACP methyl ester carboxylesterase
MFSSAGSNCCFGWGAWNVDVTADRLAREHAIQEVIMVGVDSGMGRMGELAGHGKPADDYAEFLIRELKPRMDAGFRTLKTAGNTAVIGSSLGGLSSLALGWSHPEVFGKVASLSAALQFEDEYFLKKVVAAYSGKPKAVKIYFDSGVVDFTGGDDNHALNQSLFKEFVRIGWKSGDLMFYEDSKPMTNQIELEHAGLRRDKWAEAATSQHNEFYWRLRAEKVFKFLFPSDSLLSPADSKKR